MGLADGMTQGMAKDEVSGVSGSQTTGRPPRPREDVGLYLGDSGEPLKHFKQGHDKIRFWVSEM